MSHCPPILIAQDKTMKNKDLDSIDEVVSSLLQSAKARIQNRNQEAATVRIATRSIFAMVLVLGFALIPVKAATLGGFFLFTPFGTQSLVLNTAAGTTTLGAVNTGWWDSTGFHDATNPNYGIGDGNSTPDHHNFFVFDLANVSGLVTGAQLSIGNPANGYLAPIPAGPTSVSFFDVFTAIPTLTASGAGQVGIFNDLGSGVLYSQRTVSAADNATQVIFSLNAQAVNAINAAKGSKFAVGGKIDATVPEPLTVATLSLGLLVLVLAGRRTLSL